MIQYLCLLFIILCGCGCASVRSTTSANNHKENECNVMVVSWDGVANPYNVPETYFYVNGESVGVGTRGMDAVADMLRERRPHVLYLCCAVRPSYGDWDGHPSVSPWLIEGASRTDWRMSFPDLRAKSDGCTFTPTG